MEETSQRYVMFWGMVCFFGFFLLGWPALIAWAGMAWWMSLFVKAMKGTQDHGEQSPLQKRGQSSRCRNRR